MNLREFFGKKIFLSEKLSNILIIPIKDIFPNIYYSGKSKSWSNYKIVSYIWEIDLSDTDLEKLLIISNRIIKISAFI